jgi:hypothetical protein
MIEDIWSWNLGRRGGKPKTNNRNYGMTINMNITVTFVHSSSVILITERVGTLCDKLHL